MIPSKTSSDCAQRAGRPTPTPCCGGCATPRPLWKCLRAVGLCLGTLALLVILAGIAMGRGLLVLHWLLMTMYGLLGASVLIAEMIDRRHWK